MFIAGAGIALAAVVAVLVIYMIMTPDQVEVRYGTIVRDPIDGHVWEDNTQTAWVDPSEAGNYKVEYIDKLSEEHEQMLAEAQAEQAEEQQAVEESTGLESLETTVPSDILQDLQTLQNNIQVMGQDVVTGFEMISEIAEMQSTLLTHYNQVASIPVPQEFESYKQQYLSAIEKAVAALDLYLKAIETGDTSLITEANALYQEAVAIIQDLGQTLQDLFSAIQL
jgi:hypothetical protein